MTNHKKVAIATDMRFANAACLRFMLSLKPLDFNIFMSSYAKCLLVCFCYRDPDISLHEHRTGHTTFHPRKPQLELLQSYPVNIELVLILALISIFRMTGKEPQPRPTILDSEQQLDIENGNDQFTSGKNCEPII